MIWSGDPQFRTYEQRARQARAQAFADTLAAARRALASVAARPALGRRRLARGCPSL